MTTLPILSRSGSPTTGAPSNPRASEGAIVVYREFCAARSSPLARTHDLAAVVAKYEADPDKAALISAARSALAAELYADERQTLAVFRLRAGMSQAQLAVRAGTSQSHIARIELGQNDPSTDVVVRIADALGVDSGMAFAGVRAHRADCDNS